MGKCHIFFWKHKFCLQNVQRPPAKHRQCPVRGHSANRLVIVKIIAELGHIRIIFILACHQFALQQPGLPKPFTQVLHQEGVLGPALAQQVAHTIQHGLHGGEIGLLVFVLHHRAHGNDVGQGFIGRHQRRVGKQRVSQRLQPGLARKLAFGAAFELEGQVEVFQRLFGGGGCQGGQQGGCELALLVNGFDHRLQPLAQFPQVAQAGLQLTQLNVVQTASDFLSVARDKRHRCPAIQQGHRCLDLMRLHPDFLSYLRGELGGHL